MENLQKQNKWEELEIMIREEVRSILPKPEVEPIEKLIQGKRKYWEEEINKYKECADRYLVRDEYDKATRQWEDYFKEHKELDCIPFSNLQNLVKKNAAEAFYKQAESVFTVAKSQTCLEISRDYCRQSINIDPKGDFAEKAIELASQIEQKLKK